MIALLLALSQLAQAQPTPVDPANAALVEDVLAREQEILDTVRAADPAAYDRLVRQKASDRSAYLFGLLKASRMIERAETTDTGCSGERPPQITASRVSAAITTPPALRAAWCGGCRRCRRRW